MVHLLGGYVVSMSVLEFLSKDLPEGPDTRLTHTHTRSLSLSPSPRGEVPVEEGVWSGAAVFLLGPSLPPAVSLSGLLFPYGGGLVGLASLIGVGSILRARTYSDCSWHIIHIQ